MNKNQNSTNSRSANVELDEIRIPRNYILQAKPLIDLLVCVLMLQSFLYKNKYLNKLSLQSSVVCSAMPQEALSLPTATPSNTDFVLESVAEPSSDTVQHEIEPTSTPSAPIASFSVASTSNPIDSPSNASLNKENQKVQLKRQGGKTAVITTQQYQEELMAQKIKSIKKEKKEPKNQEVKSNKGCKTKRKPFDDISNQESASIITPPKKRKTSSPNEANKVNEQASTQVLQEIIVPPLLPSDLDLDSDLDSNNCYILPYDEEFMKNLFK